MPLAMSRPIKHSISSRSTSHPAAAARAWRSRSGMRAAPAARSVPCQHSDYLSEGFCESKRCSRSTYPESYITEYT